MASTQTGSKRARRFATEVGAKRARREQHIREGNSSFWQSVGMMGTVGWSVSIPMVLGLFLGRFIDARLDSGHVFLVFCMLAGLVAGCIMAWRMIAEKL